MNIKQGDIYDYNLNNGTPATIEVVSTIGDKIEFRHIHGKTGKGSTTEDFFRQMINSGYLKKR